MDPDREFKEALISSFFFTAKTVKPNGDPPIILVCFEVKNYEKNTNELILINCWELLWHGSEGSTKPVDLYKLLSPLNVTNVIKS